MHPRVIYGLISLVSAAAGAGGSYYFTKQYLDKYYAGHIDAEVGAALELARYRWEEENEVNLQADLAAEIAEHEKKKTFYNNAAISDSGSSPVPMPAPARDALAKYQGSHLKEGNLSSAEEAAEGSGAEEEPTVIRSHSKPYRISPEECYEGEEGYTQVSYIYYLTDEILTEENDEPIEAIHDTVGFDNLQWFGTMGADSHLLYVRNDRQKLLIEIEKKEDAYSVVVMGLEPKEE